MGLLAKVSSSTTYKVLDEGTHLGICNAVIGVGLQDTPWGKKEKAYIRWEIPASRNQFERNGENFDQPMTVWENYTISLSSKANLRQVLEGWRGSNFTKAELDGFDLFSLIGKPCLLTIVHNVVGDRIYANLQSIGKVMKGQVVPPQEMESIKYAPDDIEQWEDVPEWLQEKIRSSVKKDEQQPKVQADPFKDDDIPFSQEAA
jgi:hypothetical protein